MNKHLLTTLFASLLFVFDLGAQTADFKYGVELNGGLREYNGDRGSTMYFATKQSFNYQAVGFGFSYYLNPSFDATAYGSVGDLGYYDKNLLGFRARISDIVFGLNYKFANGYIMDENSAFRPYIRAGWGGMQSVAVIQHGIPGWDKSRTWFASHWNAGFGFRFRLTPNIDLQVQELYNYSFDDNYDGLPFQRGSARLNVGTDGNKPLHDAYLYHSIGFVYNFGGNYSGGSAKVKDSDGDGVPNKIDICPKTPEGVEVDSVGCPIDTDGDGVYDAIDNCPGVVGPADNNGCPEVSEDVKAELALAAKGIFFETGKAVIKSESFDDLDKLVTIMETYPDAKLLIEGHTDNTGDAEANMKLSQDRADAVKRYLATKGVADSRMTAKGFGETQPIADNETDEGKALNRRVDFKLVY
jgi:outer membrane protein OmpA-like peptidoglycan-associated protein